MKNRGGDLVENIVLWKNTTYLEANETTCTRYKGYYFYQNYLGTRPWRGQNCNINISYLFNLKFDKSWKWGYQNLICGIKDLDLKKSVRPKPCRLWSSLKIPLPIAPDCGWGGGSQVHARLFIARTTKSINVLAFWFSPFWKGGGGRGGAHMGNEGGVPGRCEARVSFILSWKKLWRSE